MQDFALCLSSSSASTRLVSFPISWFYPGCRILSWHTITFRIVLRWGLVYLQLTAHARQRPASCSLVLFLLPCLASRRVSCIGYTHSPNLLPYQIFYIFINNVFVYVFVWLLHVASSVRLWACHICMRHPPSPKKKKKLEIIKFLLAFIMRFALDSCRRARDTQPSSF